MVRVGVVLLPEHAWDVDRARWQLAEELGFHTAWTYDHLAWRTLADGPWYATIPTLVAAALSTSTIRLGTLVASPNLRHPVTFAKDLMTLDVMSGGRLTVGVGAGTTAHDAAVLGLPELDPRRRADRFAEFVELLGQLLAHPVTDWTGEHYTAVDARMIPGSTQRPRPPLVVAANGPRGMRLAQQHGDGWITNGRTGQGLTTEEWWGSVADAVAAFDRIADEDSRHLPAGFVRLLNIETAASGATSADEVVELVERAARLGFTDVVLAWPRAGDPYRGDERVMHDLAGRLDGLADLPP
jgi:alkanesulfonate monooxygenase SsuD/methylene tetrahydromethanopterin reductase-like flavin-dependent oxidoreductase (luciferase family)